MTESKGKPIRQQIAELVQEIAVRAGNIDNMKPHLKTTAKSKEILERMKVQLENLEAQKDLPQLSETCKTHLKKWLFNYLTGKRVDFSSKQTNKGNLVEDAAIVYASLYIEEMGFAYKNEKHYKNDFLNGTPDVITDEYVFDLKASYTHETFPVFDLELPESDYYWQVLGYMALTGKQKGAVVYALMSMPEEMIQKEARWKFPEGYTEQEYEEYAQNYRYDDLAPYMRIKRYDIEYDEVKINSIENRVIECHHYIETVLWPQYLQSKNLFEI